jgi:DegT/DnrJ/EryC1/StrS aminotransferase family
VNDGAEGRRARATVRPVRRSPARPRPRGPAWRRGDHDADHLHLACQPADLDSLHALELPVVEDAAHAAESASRGRKIGGLSAATCFSLYATKNIAAGERGIVTTNDDQVAERIEQMRLMRRGHGSLYDTVDVRDAIEALRRVHAAFTR